MMYLIFQKKKFIRSSLASKFYTNILQEKKAELNRKREEAAVQAKIDAERAPRMVFIVLRFLTVSK